MDMRLEKHIDFVSLLDKDYPIRNKKLKHIQLFLSTLIKEKNKIFREWMEKGILTYDFMSQRDALIRNLFNDRYPKYYEVMYDRFYQKYIFDVTPNNLVNSKRIWLVHKLYDTWRFSACYKL